MTRSLSLCGSLIASGSAGWWFQSIRPEVYALQNLLMLFALERVTSFLSSEQESADVRDLYVAGISIGLALANHHFLAVLLILCFLPTAFAVLQQGVGFLRRCRLFIGRIGRLCLLPLRAWTDPAINLGDPITGLFWVIGAGSFKKTPEALCLNH